MILLKLNSNHSNFFFINLFIFIYLFLAALGLRCWAWAFSSCGERGLLFVSVRGLLIVVASLFVDHGFQARAGFSSCGEWAQQLWYKGLVAPRHVGSSWTRDLTCVPCIGRWILNHCTTREAPQQLLKTFLDQQYFFQRGIFYPKQCLELPMHTIILGIVAFKFSIGHEPLMAHSLVQALFLGHCIQ